MTTAAEKSCGFGVHKTITTGAMGTATRSSNTASTLERRVRARGRRARATVARGLEPAFRTEVSVCELTVTGVLSGMAWSPMDSITITGHMQQLSCDQALELVDALLLVVTRVDEFVEERYSPSTDVAPRLTADEW